ncbi:Asp23/Gls24 family envelope stress response protein [Microbacterium sp. SORGH_AS_0888]|uniref:Asp23/Gls24 family envelope stress response protein n=1 Tax=Microbacterium sp. SORGH_AS_0888 TaxID=3041791 RepID=UPI00278B269C|nr:Asp23/Gls24 family envelope stress response protein [Microbacterium sp. SORGH_AS_0888]MDQ1131203.1 putative alkaline shock family protein YloU [Microbacterium sp. SORGH_AS_0888]
MAQNITETAVAQNGKTTIVDPVVAKIAGIAAREVPGVHALGGGAARVIGNIREAVGAKDYGQGVRVEVGETEVAADISIVVDYPEELQRVANGVRTAVAEAITDLVGMKVAEINVTIVDVYIPGEDDDAETEARVQ